ncbi:MAG: DNA polymerase III subunit beta [Phycisphaerae bacterium]|nr:DNA polymerase III subunit beta [Phycisphaerae bacterium]
MIKMVCNRAALDEAVAIVRPVVAARTPKPVLQCIKLSAGKDSLTLMATDLEVTIRFEVTQVEVQQAGDAVVAADKFGEIVSKSTGETLAISAEDTALLVKSESARFKILGFPSADFPEVPAFDGQPDLTINAGLLQSMINKTIFATAKEHTRYAINGVLWEKSGKKLQLIATDGRRLAKVSGPLVESAGKDQSAIVPVKALGAIQRLLRDDDEVVAVKFTETQIMFHTDRASVTAQLVEGQFPKYQDVIPRDTNRKAEASTEELRSALTQASILTSEESKGVRLAFAANGLTMSAHSAEAGEASVQCKIDFTGEPLEIGFNPQYLMDALKVIGDPTCSIEMQESTKPGLVKAGADFLYVVMPVNLG